MRRMHLIQKLQKRRLSLVLVLVLVLDKYIDECICCIYTVLYIK